MAKNSIRAGVLSTIEAEVDALRALEAPAGDEDRIDAVLNAVQATANEVWKRKKWSKEVAVYFADTSKDMRAYGLTGCAV